MEILVLLWNLKDFLNPKFILEIVHLITKGIQFAESNFKHETGEIQKAKCLEFIRQGYNVIDTQFQFNDETDKLIKESLIPQAIDLMVSYLKIMGFI
jgi:hypothetical protein